MAEFRVCFQVAKPIPDYVRYQNMFVDKGGMAPALCACPAPPPAPALPHRPCLPAGAAVGTTQPPVGASSPPPESHWEDVPMGEDGERISSSPPPESHWEDIPMEEDAPAGGGGCVGLCRSRCGCSPCC